MFNKLFGRKEKAVQNINLYDLIPQKKFDYEVNDSNLVTILIPKFTNKFLVQHLMPRLKHPYIKIKLDEIGSAVWLEIDGKKKVGEISKILEDKFGEKIHPIDERLSRFFAQLHFNQFITFKKKESNNEQT
jgi:hypothetical protein